MDGLKNNVVSLCVTNNSKISEQTYETPDPKLASFLFCRNFQLVRFRCLDGKPIFIFADSSALGYAVVDYSEDGVVPVRTFCEALQSLENVCR
jgi:hypothetical protein